MDVAQDSEVLWISYLCEVFLVHLDQPLAVTIQSEFGGVEDVIVTALGSVLESCNFSINRRKPMFGGSSEELADTMVAPALGFSSSQH